MWRTARPAQLAWRNASSSSSTTFTTSEVPDTPLKRIAGFAQLGASLAAAAVGGGGLMTEASAEVLASHLCRMRGAALKLGQMLSLQDESMLPPPLAEALHTVRTHANIMPQSQLESMLASELGPGWESLFGSFDRQPIAAASIGQVHRAVLKDGRDVAVKVQYPGVATSITSDLGNLEALLRVTNFAPRGLFVERIIESAKEELAAECDYESEAKSQTLYAKMLEGQEEEFYVPAVIAELSTKAVITTEWVHDAVPIDEAVGEPLEVRNQLARSLLALSLRELYEFRLVQTDPNWSNFLYQKSTGRLCLIDFGATRSFKKEFVDEHLRLVWAAATRNREGFLSASENLGFLNGDESAEMVEAHVQAGWLSAEPFAEHAPYKFSEARLAERIGVHAAVFAKQRISPPPREVYALHRRLSGAISTCAKLECEIECRDTLDDTLRAYSW